MSQLYKRSKCKPATKTELKWIEDLKKLAAKRPKSLWLYAAAGQACIMKTPKDGNEMGGRHGDSTAVNPDNQIDIIHDLKCDGGDW